MNDALSKDMGENYEYIRTIVRNKIEIAKLELVENSTDIVSSIIVFISISVMSLFLLGILLLMLGIWITSILGSAIAACAIIVGLLIGTMISLIIWRNKLVITPFSNFIFNKAIKEENER